MRICSREGVTAFLLLSSLEPFAHARPNKSHHRLSRRDTITDSCSGDDKTAVQNALTEAKSIADNMKKRTQDFRQFIQDRVDGNFHLPTQDQYTAYRTFHSMFGRIWWGPGPLEHQNHDGTGLGFIDKVIATASNLQANISNEQTKLDYYCGDDWLKNKNPSGQEADPPVYWDGRTTNNPSPGWINVGGDGACRDDPKLEGQLFRHGTTAGNVRGPVDVMMICGSSISAWGSTSLTTDKNTKFTAGSKNLDDYKSKASGIILIHELSHSNEIMGGTGTVDPPLPPGNIELGVAFDFATLSQTNYGFYGVSKIASTNSYENQQTAINAAENIAFYAAALYLDKNFWGAGLVEDLQDPPS